MNSSAYRPDEISILRAENQSLREENKQLRAKVAVLEILNELIQMKVSKKPEQADG